MTNERLQLVLLEILLKNPSCECSRLDIHAKTFDKRKLIRKLHMKIQTLEKLELEAHLLEFKEAKLTLQKLSESEVTFLLEDILWAYGKQ